MLNEFGYDLERVCVCRGGGFCACVRGLSKMGEVNGRG